MKKCIYCIKDIKVSYQEPFYMANSDVAKRALSFVVNGNDTQNALCLAPQDFELWYLGEFDDVLGDLYPAKEFVCNLLELKNHDVHVSEEVTDGN